MPSRTAPSHKSTNVRTYNENARTLLFALAAGSAAVSLGAFDGVFARLPEPVDLALAVFAALFAAAAYALDRGLRARIDALPAALLVFIALCGDALAMLVALQGIAAMAHGMAALAVFLAAPLGLAANLPALRAIARRLRRAPARSPGASPAAT